MPHYSPLLPDYQFEYYLFFTSFLESGGRIWIVALLVVVFVNSEKHVNPTQCLVIVGRED